MVAAVVMMASVLVPGHASALTASYDEVPVASDRLDGVGHAVVIVGDTVYVGGAFDTVRNPAGAVIATRANLAAFDATTGRLRTAFRADTDGIVRALATDGQDLYVGGSFRQIGGQSRDRLAKLDLVTGAVDTSFRNNSSSNIYALSIGGGRLYAGGSFSTFAGETRTRVAAVDLATESVVDGFAPEVDGTVNALAVNSTGTKLFIGGGFATVNGADVGDRRLRALDGVDGSNTTPEIQQVYGTPLDLEFSDDDRYLAAATTNNDGTYYDANTGARRARQVCGGDAQAITVVRDSMFTGFHEVCEDDFSIRITSNDTRNDSARDQDFLPSFDRYWGVRGLDGNPSVLAAAGDFTNVSGVPVGGFVLFRGTGEGSNLEEIGGLPLGSQWSYLDDGSNQGSAWTQPGFNDSGWAQGNAELGYGDGDEATEIGFGPNPNNKYTTSYFRSTFSLGAEPTRVDLSLLADDGAVAYVNGVEVARDNMAGGAIGYQTPAETARSGDDESALRRFTVPPELVHGGTNTITVEVHQSGGSSSDLSFDAEVIAYAPTGTPTTTTTSTTTTTTTTLPVEETGSKSLGSQWSYLDDGSDQAGAWSQPGFDDSQWSRGDAELGYGDGDETTVIGFGPNPNDKHITSYFRSDFDVAAQPTAVDLSLVADDGAVVYINGTEVTRDNLPPGPIGFDTPAEAARGGADETDVRQVSVPANTVHPGTNTIAVEVHQSSADSSDVSFDAGIVAYAPQGSPTVPGVPTGLAVDVSSNSELGLSWDDVADEDSYALEMSAAGGPFAAVPGSPLAADTTDYDAIGLNPGTEYCFRIQATNTVGSSAFASEVCGTPGAAPETPTGLAVDTSAHSELGVSWDDVADEDSYALEMSAAGGPFAAVPGSPLAADTTDYDAIGLSPGTEYCFRIQATNSFGTSAFSSAVCGTPTAPPVSGAVAADFDGDGDSDVAVYRPADSGWLVQGGLPTTWGAPGDVALTGDFNGDGIGDVTVFRPADQTWYVQPSASFPDGLSTQWGAPGDVPVPADYNGDGVTDIAVFRPSDQTWYAQPSATLPAGVATQWGIAQDIPVPADFDGDGTDEIAVFRPADQTWYSIDGLATQWGAPGDVPLPVDFDGDGADDVAVYRPADSSWYSQGGFSTQWGATGDIAVPGDYDGDGDADVAVFRPSDSSWYSPAGLLTQWGTTGDVAVIVPVALRGLY